MIAYCTYFTRYGPPPTADSYRGAGPAAAQLTRPEHTCPEETAFGQTRPEQTRSEETSPE